MASSPSTHTSVICGGNSLARRRKLVSVGGELRLETDTLRTLWTVFEKRDPLPAMVVIGMLSNKLNAVQRE